MTNAEEHHDSVEPGSWLRVPASAEFSQYGNLAEELHRQVRKRVADGAYTDEEAYYVSQFERALCKDLLHVSDKRLEKLRELCQLWDVDLRSQNITSHRKVIGPVIVALKRKLYPVLRFFLKDFLRQQKAFNAAAISLLADLANEQGKRMSLIEVPGKGLVSAPKNGD